MSARHRVTPWLFALALALFWGCIWLAGVWWPQLRTEGQRHYDWSAAEMAGVRRVVVDPAISEYRPGVRWSGTISVSVGGRDTLRLTSDEGTTTGLAQPAPRLQLTREGDTLFVRPLQPQVPAGASAPPASPQREHRFLRVEELLLPDGVSEIEGQNLSVRVKGAQPGRELYLRGEEVTLLAGAALARLRIDSLAVPCDATPRPMDEHGSAGQPSWRLARRSAEVEVNAGGVAELLIRSADGRVVLSGLAPAQRVQLHATPGTALALERVEDMARVQWQPLPEADARALGWAPPTPATAAGLSDLGNLRDCPESAMALARPASDAGP